MRVRRQVIQSASAHRVLWQPLPRQAVLQHRKGHALRIILRWLLLLFLKAVKQCLLPCLGEAAEVAQAARKVTKPVGQTRHDLAGTSADVEEVDEADGEEEDGEKGDSEEEGGDEEDKE